LFSLFNDSRVLKERNAPLERINSLRLAAAIVVSSIAEDEGDMEVGSRYEDGSNLMAGCENAMPTPPPTPPSDLDDCPCCCLDDDDDDDGIGIGIGGDGPK
jgi:hypothetical protein